VQGVIQGGLESPVGLLDVVVTEQGIRRLEFNRGSPPDTDLQRVRHPLLEQLRRELAEYFEGRRREFAVPLVYPGTPFQVKVWDALRLIPYGETRSYEKLAWSIGCPRAQRAVGHANGQNPVAILIPCHRVINKDGKLGGYGGGLWRKQLLLDLERGRPQLDIPISRRRPSR
jgi:AraC family transcriptional regulator of adaptative response/methylated-DNA-[protein]-cysteine methyltransferase